MKNNNRSKSINYLSQKHRPPNQKYTANSMIDKRFRRTATDERKPQKNPNYKNNNPEHQSIKFIRNVQKTDLAKQGAQYSPEFRQVIIQLIPIIASYQGQYKSLNPDQRRKWMEHIKSLLKLKDSIAILKNPEEKEVLKIQDMQQDRSFSKFCCGNVLQDEEFQQEFLYNVTTKYCGKIRSTKLIYIWNPLNKSNMHQYIDNKPNLLLLISTEEDSKLAAFTQMPFKKPFPDLGFGAIISLTNRKVFLVKKDKRAISYDATYVCFGNNELLIKKNEISSNLGNAGSHYESNGEKAKILFNISSNFTKIAQLQVFQIQS